MSNLSFNKNTFTNTKPATLSKPISNNPNKLGRRTIDEIKEDMNPLKRGSAVPKTHQDMKDIQREQSRNLDVLKAFKEWNKK